MTGVEKDRDRAFPLLQILGDRAVNLIGKTTLPELVALIEKARLVLTNNTSTMHIADAVRSPNVILFSGTEHECQWAPRHSPTRLRVTSSEGFGGQDAPKSSGFQPTLYSTPITRYDKRLVLSPRLPL